MSIRNQRPDQTSHCSIWTEPESRPSRSWTARLCRIILLTSALLLLPFGLQAGRMPDQPPLKVMAGQMIMAGFRGLSVKPDSPVTRWIEGMHLGGVILFDRDLAADSQTRNVRSPKQLRRLTRGLQSRSRIPLLMAIDQEGGRVARLTPRHGFPDRPAAAELGRANDPSLTRSTAQTIGQTLSQAGINLNLAPVVDVNVNPDNPAIGRLDRSFGADPDLVAEQARAFIQGLHHAGVLACLKHFPGQGSARQDSHQGFTSISRSWSRQELQPYSQLFADGFSDAVMVGHLFNRRLDQDRPATLSRPTIQGLLRRKLGFDGLVITDDLQMQAITEHFSLKQTVIGAVRAGADMLLFGNNLVYQPNIVERAIDILLRAVDEKELSKARLRRSYHRIRRLKKRLPTGSAHKASNNAGL